MKNKPTFILWSVVSLLTIVNLIVFGYRIISAPPELRVQFTPDDTYYYLQLAKNFATLGYWTFDSGVSVASGFHPLLAYLLAGIYAIFRPSMEQFVTTAIFISSIPSLLPVIAVWVKSLLSRDIHFLIALSLFAGAQSFVLNSVTGVEWGLAISLAALYCFVFASAGPRANAVWKLFAIGLFLSLARSDAGLLPFSIFAAALFFRVGGNAPDGSLLRASLAGFAGACLGVGLVFLNNYVFTGELIQSSARMKLYWSTFQDQLLARSIIVAAQSAGVDVYLFPFSGLCLSLGAAVAALALPLWVYGVARSARARLAAASLPTVFDQRKILHVASYATVLAYVALYARGGGLQNWYTANFVVPMFLLMEAGIEFLRSRVSLRKDIVEVTLSLIVLMTIFINMRSVYPLSSSAPWPHQQAMLAAGKYLHNTTLDGRIGSWNAGIIGYYQGGEIVNLDGLVNESIYPYVVRNNLPVYLREKDIRYLVDFQTMLSPVYRRRGGYDDAQFVERLVPIARFDQDRPDEWRDLTLYRIQR